MRLARQFKEQRSLENKSLQDVAAAAGISEEDVRRAEAGDPTIELGKLGRLAQALGCDLELVEDPMQRIINDIIEMS